MQESGGGGGVAGWGASGELRDDFQFQKRKDNADERKYRKFYVEHVL